jgi:hypothetical protein
MPSLCAFAQRPTMTYVKAMCFQGFQRLSNKALAMTLTELSAMAAPAIMGLR